MKKSTSNRKHLAEKSDIIGFTGFIILITTASILATIGSTLEIMPNLSWKGVCLCTINSVTLLYLQCPVTSFTAIMIEVSTIMKSWTKSVSGSVIMSFNDCLKLNHALQLASEIFSWPFFIITLDSVILFILFSFKTIATLMGGISAEFTWQTILISIGYLSYGKHSHVHSYLQMNTANVDKFCHCR